MLTDKTWVSLVSGLCLIGLIAVLKKVLQVPQEVLTRDAIIYIVAYTAFALLFQRRKEPAKKAAYDRPLFWCLLIILTTLAIIAVYIVGR